MKLLEKLKNTFFEEEYVEVDEPVKKEETTIAKKIEPKEVKREAKKVQPPISVEEEKKVADIEEISNKVENYQDNQLSKKDSKLPYFEDEDFVDATVYSKQEKEKQPKTLYGENVDKIYHNIQYSVDNNGKPYGPTKETFRPTPIISPIYGILDKNYTKEEVIDKKDKPSSYVSKRHVDLDSVRKKAYGGLDPFDDGSMQSSVVEEAEPVDESLLYDMTDGSSKPQVERVTIADAEEYFSDLGLEYNIDYKDSSYEKATGRRTSSNTSNLIEENHEDLAESIDEIKDDNLFELIDSIYEKGEE